MRSNPSHRLLSLFLSFLLGSLLSIGLSARAADWDPKLQVVAGSSTGYYLTVRAYGPGPQGDGTGGYNAHTSNTSVVKSVAFEVLAADGSVARRYAAAYVDWYGIGWTTGLNAVATGAQARLTATTNDGKTARSRIFRYLVEQPQLDVGTAAPSLALSPSTATVASGQQAAFAATVTNGGTAVVVWSVQEAACGTVSAGVYTAPVTSVAKTCHVQAALSGSTLSALATVTVSPALPPTLTLNPATAAVWSGQTTSFAATVTNGGGAAVVWSVQEAGCGTVAAGLYTAPATASVLVCHVKAALSGSTVSASASVTVNPVGSAVSRPAANLSTGFFVLGSKLYDATGQEFVMRGVNANHWWGYEPDNEIGIGYIKATQANAARVVFGPDPDKLGYLCQTTAERRTVVKKFIDHHLVPIVEYHNATGSDDPALVDQAVNLWIAEPWVREFERYVIINITNEWSTQGNEALWRDTYVKAIKKLRAAGVNNTLVIDSIQYGQGTSALLQYAKDVFNADPQKNVVFSLHMYGGWLAPTDPTPEDDYHHRIDKALPTLIALGLPLMVGEFNHTEGSMPDAVLIDEVEKRGIGWLGWMFFNSDGHIENMMNSIASPRYLTDFGATLVKAFAAKAKEAPIFGGTVVPTLPKLPSPVVVDPSKTWNPGNVVLKNVATWWMEASVSTSVTNLYRIEMEMPDGSRIEMGGWGTNNFNLNIDLGAIIANNQNVRFWVYSTEGAVAKTVYGRLYSGAIFAIAN